MPRAVSAQKRGAEDICHSATRTHKFQPESHVVGKEASFGRYEEASNILALKVVKTRFIVDTKAHIKGTVFLDYHLVIIVHNRPETGNLASVDN
ncbi:hypothetical protein LIG30_0794 [Burkholderia sp. lig30]|jgi:hypothetical protein|nr:hypothetical protein LIG30_0794 [Burkholderia sp. lig30]